MARVKSDKANLIQVRDWQQADDLIHDIGQFGIAITQFEAKAKQKIDGIKADMASQVKSCQDGIDLYMRSLEAFATAHADEFEKQRSRKLNFGVIGWRKSTAIRVGKKTLDLIREKLSAAKAKVCIRTKESIDRDALAKLTDDELAGIKARREIRDVFFVEPDIPKAAKY